MILNAWELLVHKFELVDKYKNLEGKTIANSIAQASLEMYCALTGEAREIVVKKIFKYK